MTCRPSEDSDQPSFAGRAGHFVNFVVLWLFIILWVVSLASTILISFISSVLVPETPRAMVFMYNCVCLSPLILQTSSSTHLHRSQRSTRDEWTPRCSYCLLVGPWWTVTRTSTSLRDEIIWGTKKEIGIIPVVRGAVLHQVISVGICAHERNDDCGICHTVRIDKMSKRLFFFFLHETACLMSPRNANHFD